MLGEPALGLDFASSAASRSGDTGAQFGGAAVFGSKIITDGGSGGSFSSLLLGAALFAGGFWLWRKMKKRKK